MKPTIGRIVHYTSFGTPGGEHLPEPRAAIITAIHSDEDVALAVLNPTGLFFSVDVPHSEHPKPGHWNWPPREELPKNRASGGRTGHSGGPALPPDSVFTRLDEAAKAGTLPPSIAFEQVAR